MADETILPSVSDTEAITQSVTQTGAAVDKLTASNLAAVDANNRHSSSVIDNIAQQGKAIFSSKLLKDNFDLLAQAALGASSAFNNFSSSMDQTQGFETQAARVVDLINNNKLLGTSLREVAGSLGMKDVLSATTAGLTAFIMETAKGADQSLRLQKGYTSLMGETGNLGSFYDKAGDHLKHMNDMMLTQNELINRISGSTGATKEQVSGFYQLLGTSLPTSLTQGSSAVDSQAKSFNTLKDAMDLAAGTGRTVNDVIGSMKKGFEAYGVEGEKALIFTSRMSQLNNDFHIPLEYTRKFLYANAESFKMLSSQVDNSNDSFSRWFGSLQGTGLSAKNSVEVIEGMTKGLAGLTVAQKAFLSAQTGGPGGLRGALQIEGLIRDGKIDEVLQKTEQVLKKQFGGKIYSQAEGQESEFAAAQFIRQRQMITSGAFGIKADEGQATRILEAFKTGKPAAAELRGKDNDGGLSDFRNKGEEQQKSSSTYFSTLINQADRQLALSSKSSIDTIQQLVGINENTKNPNIKNLVGDYRKESNEKMLMTGAVAQAPGTPKGFAQELAIDNMKDGINSLKAIPGMKEIAESLEKRFKSDNPSVRQGAFNEYQKIKNTRNFENAKNQTDFDQEQMRREREANKARDLSSYTSKGGATNRVVAQSLNNSKPKEEQSANQDSFNEKGKVNTSKVEVTFKGLCVNCAQPVQPDSDIGAITSGTAGQSQ